VKYRVIDVTEFKAKCLGLFEEVRRTGGTITITKRGQPIAKVGPAPRRRKFRSPEGCLVGKIEIDDDLLMSDMAHMFTFDRDNM